MPGVWQSEITNRKSQMKELIVDAGIIKKPKLESLMVEADELVRIFQSTRTTARSR
jgi:hypothetical protein